MGLREWWRDIQTPHQESRDNLPLTLDAYVAQVMSYQGSVYPLLNQTMPGTSMEQIGGNFVGLSQGAYKSNGIVFACMAVRFLLFSEARFQFRQIRNGRPGDLFGTAALNPLETPWQNATTGDLLTRAITDADLSGNFFAVRRGNGLKRLRPDWMTIVIGSDSNPEAVAGDIDADVLGYIYHPGGIHSERDPVPLDVKEVAHFAPIPDPEASYRGMSWLTPIINEVMGDTAATQHKLKFFENGATSNMVVTLGNPGDRPMSDEKFQKWIERFDEKHKGVANAYATLFLAQGSDAKVVGADFRQMDFKVTQGAGETRIAAAAGTPPVLVGLSEGLASATYSNYTQARRRFADATMRPMWRNFAGSMASIIDVPSGAELWYDDRDIPFLREDIKDSGEHQQRQAIAVQTLVMAGFDPDSVIEAVVSSDLARLKHTGLVSVQMQPPAKPNDGTAPDPSALVPASSNGNGSQP